MQRIAFVATVLALAWCDTAFRIAAQTTPGDAPHIGQGGLPQFAEERGWLKLPAKWRLGNTSAVSVERTGTSGCCIGRARCRRS